MSRDATPHPLLLQVALALGAFAIGTVEFGSMTLLPDFTRELGVSAAAGSQAISAYAFGVVVGSPLFALWGASRSKRALLTILMLAFAVGNVASAFAPTFATLVAFRFLSGLPHGAYLGVASVLASTLVPPNKRAQAVARVMLGLTLATVVGVPLASGFGRDLGWRSLFLVVTAIALVTALGIWLAAPRLPVEPGAGWRRELPALKRRQIWLTLGIGAVGQGGMFAVYSYLASTLDAAEAGPEVLATALMLFGLGLLVSLMVSGWLADRNLTGAMVRCLLWSAVTMGLYALAVDSVPLILVAVFLVGGGGGLGVPVQTRLLDVAGEAQTLAASLNHAAFNVANALGPACAGMALAAGYGWSSTGWVGVGLSFGGLGMLGWALLDESRERAVDSAPDPSLASAE